MISSSSEDNNEEENNSSNNSQGVMLQFPQDFWHNPPPKPPELEDFSEQDWKDAYQRIAVLAPPWRQFWYGLGVYGCVLYLITYVYANNLMSLMTLPRMLTT